ncbi:MAG: nucleotidyl transferase AbiEii/AbiGii toxin family protein [Fibrobacterota bacterium]
MDNNQKKREALLTTVMNLFSETFRNKAILHGGMVLRLLECPRYTNDLDYLFVPFKSKNDVKEMILGALKTIPGLKLSHSMNSKCLRILLKGTENVTAQVEVKVDMECKTDVLTSAPLSRIYNQPARVIAVIDFGTALANKMSAWLDRRLMRDLYDIHFLLNMGILPDLDILIRRLKKPEYAKGVAPFPGPLPLDRRSFYGFLKDETLKLEDRDIAGELSDILAEQERTGLALRIKAAITSRL